MDLEVYKDDPLLFQYSLRLHKKYKRLYFMYTEETNNMWVVKTYSKSDMANREWTMLKALHHLDCVPKPYAFYKYNTEDMSIIMEYVNGLDLFDYMDKYGLFNETSIKPILKKLLTKVGEIHKLDIVHGDIKPENILYKNNGDLYLIDFEGRHTPEYLAPERIKTKASDVWAIGVTCFVLLTNLFPNKNVMVYPQEWSPLFLNFISSMLTVDPKIRNTIDGLLKHPFLT